MNKIIENPRRIINILAARGMLKFLPDEQYLKLRYWAAFGRKLDLDNPVRFTEKLQWLKLHDRNPEYSRMVDKYQAKKYVADIIGENYIIPTFGVWDSFDEIEFDKLPARFVLKCTHDSGGLVICKDKDKLDKKKTKEKIEKSLKNNYYLWGREWPYKNVRPHIIAEQFMLDSKESDLIDYKFYCFNGEPKYCQVIKNRSSMETIDFFNMAWEHQNFTGIGVPLKPQSTLPIQCPRSFKEMKEKAHILSQKMKFVRIDFYEINEKMYFGEITFFPASGFGKIAPEEMDLVLGDLLKI